MLASVQTAPAEPGYIALGELNNFLIAEKTTDKRGISYPFLEDSAVNFQLQNSTTSWQQLKNGK